MLERFVETYIFSICLLCWIRKFMLPSWRWRKCYLICMQGILNIAAKNITVT